MEEHDSVCTDVIVSVAIEINNVLHLRKINQNNNLTKVLEEICRDFRELVESPDNYGLQFDDKHPTLAFRYISEENRFEIKDGTVCRLVYSPTYLVNLVIKKMKSPTAEENLWSLQKITAFTPDKVVVEKFLEENGVTELANLLKENALSYEATGYAFQCFSDILHLGRVDLNIIKGKILENILQNILTTEKVSSKTKEACLSIANFLMGEHASEFPEIFKSVPIERVLPYLDSDDSRVRKTALALINSIFNTATSIQRKLLIKAYAKTIRETLYKKVISTKTLINDDMIHHLALFQARFVSRLRRKAESPADMSDSLVKKRISMLSRLQSRDEVPDADLEKRRNTFIETTLTLLSDYVIPPPIDLLDVPPSILVLDCMTYFIKTYEENYMRAVLQHSIKTSDVRNEYPFVQLCTQLVTLLTNCLGITRPAEEDSITKPAEVDSTVYYAVLYSCDKAFEELFCATIMVFSKTSKEMRARKEDFKKVMYIVEKKIRVVLKTNPLNLKEYQQNFYTLSYVNICQILEREEEEKVCQDLKEKKSLLKIRDDVRAEYLSLIKQQRLHALGTGAHFKYYPKKLKYRKVHIKYIPSRKVFEFVDEVEKFSNFSIDLANIKNIVVGQNCTHVKLKGQKYKPEFAFTLLLTDQEPNCINLAAFTERQLDHVLDGFRVLLNMDMISPSCEEDVQTLTDMHVRLELLDSYGIDLPSGEAPQIPPDPSDYDFP